MKDKKLLYISLLFFFLSGLLVAGICRANEYDPFDETEDFLSVPDPPPKESWWYHWMTPIVPYDTTEKVLLGTLVATNAADAATTITALNNGAEEANPLLGSNPSNTTIIASKAAFVGLFILLANQMDHVARKWTMGGLSVLFGAVSLHNLSVINDIN